MASKNMPMCAVSHFAMFAWWQEVYGVFATTACLQ